jgi:peptidyl-prolyl cis-trans isomerase A (cyclophilin A)
MRIQTLIVAAALTCGCQKAKDNPSNASGSSAPSGSAAGTAAAGTGGIAPVQREVLPAEPVHKDPTPPPSMDDVRAPVATDLAEFTKDLPGDAPLVATMETTLGTFHCTLFADKAPLTVASFVGLATGKKPWQDPANGSTVKGKPFFDGLTFHRVIPTFMAQGGDPVGNGTGGPGYAFVNETRPDLKFDKPGVLAMANAGPDTNGSQFFITEAPRPDLNGGYTIFGQCAEGDLVKKITGVPRDARDKPNTPVVINKVTIARATK